MTVHHDSEPKSRWFSYAMWIAFLAGFGFFALSFVVLGILPGRQLASLVKEQAPVNMAAYTPEQERGRQIYAREGCAYCHTQQVRFTPEDVARFGAPTEAWETKYDAPQLWGTRRIGPDLAREAAVRSDDWQLTHLYNPRLTVADSVMPGYPWLFDGKASVPSQDATDLLAYLQVLGRPRIDSGYAAAPPSMDDPAMAGLHGEDLVPAAIANAVAADPANPTAPVVTTGSSFNLSRGKELFASNCASCHGANGDGQSSAAASLLPRPADLTANHYAPQRVASALWNGVAGTAMPAWRDLPQRDLQALTSFVVSLNQDRVTEANADATLVTKGSQIFAANCTTCHGPQGGGDGPAATALQPRPTNFHIERPTEAHALSAITDGIPGTSMPSWKTKLDDEDRRAVVAYLRSLSAAPLQGE